jgi:heme/copper-type cytochrome/quinol oxidase subunit 2
MVWTVIPLIMVMWIGWAAYGGLMTLDHGIPASDVSTDITIHASQWNWQADYGHGVTVFSNPDMAHHGNVSAENTFYVPAGEAVRFNITSDDVIHAWQVLDANNGYVMFVDANPLGANKWNQQTARFPAGEYMVQCNKMCLNPGHAYMHAAIKSVPRAEYDHWLLDRHAHAGKPGQVVLSYGLTVTAGGLGGPGGAPLGNQTVVTDARIVLDVANPTDDPVKLSLDGQPLGAVTLTGTGSPEIAPHGQAFFAFETGKEPATYSLDASNGGHVAFEAIAAKPIKVQLADFQLVPNHIEMKVGTTYLIQLQNVHVAVHNLYIGHHGGDVLANSDSLAPGGAGSFLYTPTTAGQYEMWCNIAGHYDAGTHGGMHGTVTIS